MKSSVCVKISILILSLLMIILINGQIRVFDDSRDIEITSSEHFNYIYKSPLRETAKEIAEMAEAQFDVLSKTMRTHPYSKINILITDNADVPNGFAATILNQTINIFMTNPEPSFIAKHYHWVEFVLFHEMTHIFNMTATSPSCLKSLNNNLFYLPNSLMPLWVLEGYTVYNESTILSGRLYDTNYEAYLRAMILDNTVQSIHRASDGLNRRWPYATLGYLYGAYIFEEYARNNADLTDFNELNFCTCLPLGILFPDIMTKIKTGKYPAAMLNKAIGRAWERTEKITNNFVSADRHKISSQSGSNGIPVYIKSQGGLFYKKFSEIRPKYFTSYNNGKTKELFRTSSSKSFYYDENNKKLYYEFLNLHNNQLYFYDIYVYDFENGGSQILDNTTRGMYPIMIDSKTLLFIRHRFDTQYFIIYDIDTQMAIDSFNFDPSYRYYNPCLKDNKLLIAIYRNGGYSDIGLIDIDTKTIE
ncbi:hypothetical protein KAU15_03765, partial [candidate division WOR-3 bacterium]|nr:hypothetical protein [candidate division WOR-3 bacterium]